MEVSILTLVKIKNRWKFKYKKFEIYEKNYFEGSIQILQTVSTVL